MGLSPKLHARGTGRAVGQYLGAACREPRPSLSLEIVLENQQDNRSSSIWARIRRGSGPRTSTWLTGSGWN